MPHGKDNIDILASERPAPGSPVECGQAICGIPLHSPRTARTPVSAYNPTPCRPRVNVRLLITFQIFAMSDSFTGVIIITDRTDCTDRHRHVM